MCTHTRELECRPTHACKFYLPSKVSNISPKIFLVSVSFVVSTHVTPSSSCALSLHQFSHSFLDSCFTNCEYKANPSKQNEHLCLGGLFLWKRIAALLRAYSLPPFNRAERAMTYERHKFTTLPRPCAPSNRRMTTNI